MLAAVTLTMLLGASSVGAFEGHNPIEPPFGSFKQIGGVSVDQATGNVYVTERWNDVEGHNGHEEAEAFGPGGGAPLGNQPNLTDKASPFGELADTMGGVAFDSACVERGLSGSECATFDPSNGDVYAESGSGVDRFGLNGSDEYEYLSRLDPTGLIGTHLSEPYGVQTIAVDAAGDIYAVGDGESGPPWVFEFDAAGEQINLFPTGAEFIRALAVGGDGTIYFSTFFNNYESSEVLELKRSSLTGPVEGAPVVVPDTRGSTGIAYDRADEELFVDLGSSAEALNAGGEVISRFGNGAISIGGGIAVDEGTGPGRGDVYVVNEKEQKIDRFTPGFAETLPVVDEVAPSFSDVTRTSALLSAAVNTGHALTSWQIEYVRGEEYEPNATNPYARGGATPLLSLPGVVGGTPVGPVALTGLLAGTTYDYRIVASNELGKTYGPNLTFTTAAATLPIVTTGPAAEVTQTGVLLTGTVDTRELQTSYEFEVGTDTGYHGAKLFGNAGTAGTVTVSMPLQYLIPGTTYHYRLAATDADGTTYGQDVAFTTPGVSQTISQPVAEPFVPAVAEAFPSTAGAVTKAKGTTKRHSRKARKRHKTARKRHRSAQGGRGKGKRK